MKFLLKQIFILTLLGVSISLAQVAEEKKWMSVGAINNWYSNYGSEREEGWVADQQYGWQWPALYAEQDMQAAKGLWIGTTDYTDGKGSFQFKVVHVGPRATGAGEFFPVKFQMTSKYDPPAVTVDGSSTYGKLIETDAVDKTLKYDRVIDNVVNTSIGLTMNRKIIGFSQEYHDNYIVFDYTFTNTGIVDEKGTTRLPVPLTGVYIYFQNRLSVNRYSALAMGINSLQWGTQTMNDVSGDTAVAHTFPGFDGDKDSDIRASYSWHGRQDGYSGIAGAEIGGYTPVGHLETGDTLGRVAAHQFIGWGTLHADTSPSDTTDNKGQPSTTSYESSDDDFNRNNDQFNAAKMAGEYAWMIKGHVIPRHADKVGLGSNPGINSGGQSSAQAYGPYTLAPGQSIRIVIAEAASGISREQSEIVGRQFKRGQISIDQKNAVFYTGKDSLFKTFKRAIANYSANWNIPQPPPPPKTFSVNSGAGKISLSWEPNTDNSADPVVSKWEVWRATGRYDSTYYKVWEGTGSAFSDTTASMNTAYYYYLTAVGDASANTGEGITPAGALRSNRYYTQTYLPAYRRTPPFKTLAEARGKIRVVPNPYNISAKGGLLFPGENDKISFVNVPGECTIRIYSELGELVKTLENTARTGSLDYDMTTSSNQIIVSGLYIAVITTPLGEKEILKFVVIR
ncbi:MAG: hypothetical protein WCT99_06075 [Bacteroidota bacterium]|jgi:hypothetical protein